MAEIINPSFLLIFTGFSFLFIGNRVIRRVLLISVPLFVLVQVLSLEEGERWVLRILNYELITGKMDKLSLVFSYVFALITLLGNVYALHVEDRGHHAAALIYSGASFGVLFAGDWITLLVFWELMAISSTFLIWYGKKETSFGAGFRYLMVHLFGGAILLAGILLVISSSGTIRIAKIEEMSCASLLILFGFLINASCPPLHTWLPDAYPEANPVGSVFLSAYTTKSAVYILLRVFPGNEILTWAGAVMAVYGVVYAVLENNMRRLLSYHIICQVGYMVCGVGLGSYMAMNGSVAHAFCNILYKALLFMAVGSVIFATDREKISELTGTELYRKIPLTLYFYMIGALSISGVPLFTGFVSKPIIIYASGELHRPLVNALLHFASVGTFLSVALKLPYGCWFGRKRHLKVKPIPLNMYVSMALTSILCILIGLYPQVLYRYLPYDAVFNPYTAYNVIGTLQLFTFVLIAFLILKEKLSPERKISLDMDWFYRKGGFFFLKFCEKGYNLRLLVQDFVSGLLREVFIIFGENPMNLKRLFFRRKDGAIKSYDPDLYRYPVGVGITIFLLLYALIAVILLLL